MIGRVEHVVGYSLLIVFSALSIGPIVGVVMQSFSGQRIGEDWTLNNVETAWSVGRFSTTLQASFIVAVGTTALCLVLSVCAGYAFGCMRFRGATILFYLILLGMIVPLEPVVISLYYTFLHVSLINTYQGLILAEALVFFPFGVFWMRAFFRSVPRSLLDAARIDGASEFGTLRSVLLRPALPAMLTLGVLVFVWSWNEFLVSLVLFSGGEVTTAPVSVAIFTGQYFVDIPSQAAAALILSLPPLILYLLFQRQFIRGVLAGSMKG
jgi:raffinose/stachyose/melibiose transport system permease protein